MDNKYSITNEDHIYYEISETYRKEIESFCDWLSTFCSGYEVDSESVTFGKFKFLFDNNRKGIIKCISDKESFETWWNPDSENLSAKKKIKKFLGL